MRIPSYDDLAPSIPDISTREAHAQAARILPAEERAAAAPARRDARGAGPSTSSRGTLFACLRSTGAVDALVTMAREFSPRLERHGPACVVLDVSGLGRLLGDAQAIGAELHRTAAAYLASSRHHPTAPTTRGGDPGLHPTAPTTRGGDPGLQAAATRSLRGDATPARGGSPALRHRQDTDAAICVRSATGAPGERDAEIRIAVAPTQTAAQLLTLVPPAAPQPEAQAGDVAATLAPLPIDTLRAFMHGAESGFHPTAPHTSGGDPGCHPNAWSGGKVAARMKATAGRLDTFARWGLKTLGDIAALPAADLSERMGQDGLLLQRLAQGIDQAPLVPDPGVPRFLESIELEWPIDALEPLSFVLARLLDPLAAALERADRGAAALRLDLRLVDRTVHARMLQLPAAIRDARVLRTLLLLDLESHPPPAGIDIVTLEIDPAPARIIQYSLLERALPSPETLATLTARLGALVGENRCGSPALLDTCRPDGFEMRRFAPEVARVRRRDLSPSVRGPGSPRLRRTVVAAAPVQQTLSSPDGAAPHTGPMGGHARTAGAAVDTPGRPRDGLVLRRFRLPIAIRVTVERGRPVRVAIDRRGMPGGRVEQQAGPWRTSGAWWDAAGAAWDRDEWDVALSDGALCRLFRDRLTETWFLEGVLD